MKSQRNIPLFLQGDARWGQQPYGNTVMAACGCGPTCLSMVVCGLTGDDSQTPAAVAQYAMEHDYYVPGFGTSLELMTAGAQAFGLQAVQGIASAAYICEKAGNGIPMICRMGTGDFIEGDTHFIVLTALDEKGRVWVNDPLSKEKSQKFWDADRLAAQMLDIWSYTVENRA